MNRKIAYLAYAVCVAGFVWLGLGSYQFRQSIRSHLHEAYALIDSSDPHARGGLAGKTLNHYYEDIYGSLPAVFIPATMLMLGATVLLLTRGRVKHSPEQLDSSA